MKKHYTPVVALALLAFTLLANFAEAQSFVPYTRIKLYNWSDPFESYQYNILGSDNYGGADPNTNIWRFRILKPNNFDSAPVGTKFPLIVFLHGSGEGSSTQDNRDAQDNEKQLLHGGQTHMNAVRGVPFGQNIKFNGLLLYPQIRDSDRTWNKTRLNSVRILIDKMITDYKVDPDRIYIHGLSGGGEGVYRLITAYPEYFAAAHPMSAAGNNYWQQGGADPNDYGIREYYKHIPLRTSQGALDNNPRPDEGNDQVQAIRAIGGDVRYAYYPTLGHGTWNSEYAKADFFSWFLSKKKNMIWVENQQTSFCAGDAINIKLGVTANNPIGNNSIMRIVEWQWEKDGSPFGGNTNEITVTQTGSYRVRFRRQDPSLGWSEWSDPVVIDNNKGPSPTPTISTGGKSTTLPALDGSPDVTLLGPANKFFYQWQLNGSNVAQTQNFVASTAGNYTVAVRDNPGTGFAANGITPSEFRATPVGCLSIYSQPVCVTTQSTLNTPAPPTNFAANTLSQTSIRINWDDRSANETGFELYRSTSAGSGYVLVTIIPATNSANNPQAYTDTNLTPGTTYYYRMRAYSCEGGSAYTPVVSANTGLDTTPPTAPVISLGIVMRNQVNFSWPAATDNVGVTEYNIYQDGVLVASTTNLTYKSTNVVAFQWYTFTVRAKDAAGNLSPVSNQLSVQAINTGLLYDYYTTDGSITTTDNIENFTYVKSGVVANFDMSPRTQTISYAFIYDGFITIPTTGNYTFYISSDDGSRLYINNNQVINYDGNHGCSEKSGSVSLTAGIYPIKVRYFQNAGGSCLTVRWQGPGISKQTIPDSRLRDAATNPASVSAPSNFTANSAPTFNSIQLRWTDNANNETGFEISRSLTQNGTYTNIAVAPAGPGTGSTRTYTDTGLTPATNYYYRIRAINATNASSWVNIVASSFNSALFVRTANAPTAPLVPTLNVPTVVSATQLNLSWSNVSNETGYELQRSTSNNPATFTTIATTATNVVTFSDTQVNGHSTYYYRVRSLGSGGTASAYSNIVSATTLNRAPLLPTVANQYITTQPPFALNAPQTIAVTATDADGDPIAFTFPNGLPTGATASDDGYGRLVLTFVNVPAQPNFTMSINASDGLATTNTTFTIIFGANTNPVTSPAVITNQVVEEGRSLSLVITVTDPEGNNTLNQPTGSDLINLPSFVSTAWTGTTSNPRIFTLTISPQVGQAGVYENITINFRDNAGGLTTRTFSLIVTPVDRFFTIAVNFVSNNVPAFYEAPPWNNMGAPVGTARTGLLDDQSKIVPYITFNTTNSWNNTSGTYTTTLPADANAVFTKKVRESFYRRNGNTNTTMTFANLNTKLKYRVTVYGASPSGTPLTSRFTISGLGAPGTNQTTDQLTTNNTSNTWTSNYMSPTAAGNLTVNVTKPTTTGEYYYVSAIILTGSFTDAPEPPTAPTNLQLTALSNTSVKVDWQDNSSNETGFRIFRSAAAAGPFVEVGNVGADIHTFTNTGLTGRTTYYYKVEAYNAFPPPTETAVGVITTPNGLPVLTNPGTITVRAGQTVNTNISATDPENDAITLSGQNIPAFASFVDNGNGTGFFIFSPQVANIGTYSIAVKAADNFGGEIIQNFTLLVLDEEIDEAVYFNFASTNESAASAPWYNTVLPYNNMGSVLNSIGETSNSGPGFSSMQLNVNIWTGNSNTLGVNTGNNSGIYPDNVLQSGWTTTSSTTGVTITLANLDNSKRYNIALVGSRNEYWFTNTIYTVGGVSKTLYTSKNQNNIVRFTGIAPTGGAITINVKKAANEVTVTPALSVPHRDAVLSGMVVEAYTPGAKPRRPSNLTARGITKNSIQLSWWDNSSDEDASGGFEIWRSESQTGPFSLIASVNQNVETYTNTGLPQNKAYIYRVRAKKGGQFSDYSNDALATSLDQIILINVNSAAGAGHAQAAAPWNNLALPAQEGLEFLNFTNFDGAATTVDLEITKWGLGGNNVNGYVTGTVRTYPNYPDEVLQNYYYYEAYDDATEYVLKDLDPTKDYDLLFLGNQWSGNTQAGMIYATEYSANGQTIGQYNGKNIDRKDAIRGIRPGPDGTITFSIKAADNDGGRYGIWNSLEIQSYTPLAATFDTEPPSVPLNLVASNITDVSFTLSWDASTDNVGVGSYEVYRGSTLIATVPLTTTSITGLQPATTYIVSVRAVDLKGNVSGYSQALQVTTLPSTVVPTDYYSKATGDITDVTTWGTNPDGTGSNPLNFVENDQQYILTRNAAVSSPWTVSGSNSRVVVMDNVELTIDEILDGFVEVRNNAHLYVNATEAPQFGTLAPTSTITFSGNPNNIPGANYGNIEFTGNASIKTFSAGTYLVQNLSINDGVELNGATSNNTTLSIAGNLTVNGNPALASPDRLLTLNFNSGTSQNLTANESAISFYKMEVSNNSSLNINNNGVTPVEITLGSTAAGGGLVIANGSYLDLKGNSLVVTGAAGINTNEETGEIWTRNGTLTINSTGAIFSNLYFNSTGVRDTLRSLTLNSNPSGQVTIQSKLNIREKLEITNGRLNANEKLVLVSNAAGTAYVAPIRNQGTIVGKLEFQRYVLSKGQIYRYLSTPVFNIKVADWQKGMKIVGPFTGSNNINSPSHSFYFYDEENGGWQPFPVATNQETLTVGRGYSLVDFATTSSKLRLTGNVKQGNHDFTLTGNYSGIDNPGAPTEKDRYGDVGWNLLGNPYPAPIRWTDAGWTSQDIAQTIYIRNNVTWETGTFEWYNKETALGSPGFTGVIAQGQAFWVQASGPDPALRLTEDAKFITNNATVYRETSPRNYVLMTLQKGTRKDYAYVHFNEHGTDGIDPKVDASKFMEDEFNLATLIGNTKMALNTFGMSFCEKDINLSITKALPGNYTLRFDDLSSFDYPVEVTLFDQFTGSETTITEGKTYTFMVTEDAQTYGNNRFMLRIAKPAIRTTIPVLLRDAVACEAGQSASLTLQETQAGVMYDVLANNLLLTSFQGTGSTAEISLPSSGFVYGENQLSLRAAYDGCSPTPLSTTAMLTYKATHTPQVPDASVCQSEVATLSASGAPNGGMYNWYKQEGDESPLASDASGFFITPTLKNSTAYFVGIQYDGCEGVRKKVLVDVNVVEKPVINVSGANLVSSVETNIQWLINGVPIENATGHTFEPVESGLYSVAATSGGCTKISESIEFMVTGTEGSAHQDGVTLYPNPVVDYIKLKLPESIKNNQKVTIQFYDSEGRFIRKVSRNNTPSGIELDASALGSGYYVLYIEVKGKLVHRKFLKL
ncbi:MAG: fibronectin type III domain-containing protein [Cyclobacteriaceae bacterium]|nr:fibronectin type III domain-containing protein [Cyclobacteriaceae bacterium]